MNSGLWLLSKITISFGGMPSQHIVIGSNRTKEQNATIVFEIIL